VKTRFEGKYFRRENMKKILNIFIGLLILTLAFTACAPAATPEPAAADETTAEEAVVEEPTAVPITVALVPAGRIGMEGFMFLAGEGYKEASADFGFEQRILESEVPEEWERNVRTAAQEGYTLIVGVGSTMTDAVANVAPDFPDTHFALVDANPGGDNTVGLISQEQEGAFLAGALAAMMTTQTDLENMNEAKVIGFVGGMDVPSVNRFISGYKQGAAYISPGVEVLVSYVGSFRDPAKAKELALDMFQNQDVDIVMSVCGSSGDVGVFEAVEESGAYGIGADVNWDTTVPGHILTSVLKHTDKAVYDVIAREFAGEFQSGEIRYGVADGVMDITDMSTMGDKIPQEVRDRIDDIKAKITSGEIVVNRPE
jgi:basic membrane protein A